MVSHVSAFVATRMVFCDDVFRNLNKKKRDFSNREEIVFAFASSIKLKYRKQIQSN